MALACRASTRPRALLQQSKNDVYYYGQNQAQDEEGNEREIKRNITPLNENIAGQPEAALVHQDNEQPGKNQYAPANEQYLTHVAPFHTSFIIAQLQVLRSLKFCSARVVPYMLNVIASGVSPEVISVSPLKSTIAFGYGQGYNKTNC